MMLNQHEHKYSVSCIALVQTAYIAKTLLLNLYACTAYKNFEHHILRL